MPRKMIDIRSRCRMTSRADPPGYGPSIATSTTSRPRKSLHILSGAEGRGTARPRRAEAIEWIKLSTHCGTHLDAPYHFASTMDRGKRAATIDEIPAGVVPESRGEAQTSGISPTACRHSRSPSRTQAHLATPRAV